MGYEQALEDVSRQQRDIRETRSRLAEEKKKAKTARQQISERIEELKQQRFAQKPYQQIATAREIERLQSEKLKAEAGERAVSEAEREVFLASEQAEEQQKLLKQYQKEGYAIETSPTGEYKFTKKVPSKVVSGRRKVSQKDVYKPIYDKINTKQKQVNTLKKARDTLFKVKKRAVSEGAKKLIDKRIDGLNARIRSLNDDIRSLRGKTPSGATKSIKQYEIMSKTLERLSKSPSESIQKIAERFQPTLERIAPSQETYLTSIGVTKTAFEKLGGFNIPAYSDEGVFYKGASFNVSKDSFDDVKKYFEKRSKYIAGQLRIREQPLNEIWREKIKLPSSLMGKISEKDFEEQYYKFAVAGSLSADEFKDWTFGKVADWERAQREKEAEEDERFAYLRTAPIRVEEGITVTPSVTEVSPFLQSEEGKRVLESALEQGRVMDYMSDPRTGMTATASDLPWTPQGALKVSTISGKLDTDYQTVLDKQLRELDKVTSPKGFLASYTGGLTKGTLLPAEQKQHYVGKIAGKDVYVPQPSYNVLYDIVPKNTQFSEVVNNIGESESDILNNLRILKENEDMIRESPLRDWKMNIDDDPALETVSADKALEVLGEQRKDFEVALKNVRMQKGMVTKLNKLGYGIRKVKGGGWEFYTASTEELFERIPKDPGTAFKTESVWTGGLFGLPILFQKGVSLITGEKEDWKTEELKVKTAVIEKAYSIKRTKIKGGKDWFPALFETLASPTGQDIALFVGTLGFGKAIKGGVEIAKAGKWGQRITAWSATTKLGQPATGFARALGKAPTVISKIPKPVSRYAIKPLVVGGFIGYESAQVAKTYREGTPAEAFRQVGRIGISFAGFGLGYKTGFPGKPTVYKGEIPTFKKVPGIKADFVKFTGGLKEKAWYRFPKVTGQLAVAKGRVGDLYRTGVFQAKESYGAFSELARAQGRVVGGYVGDTFRYAKYRLGEGVYSGRIFYATQIKPIPTEVKSFALTYRPSIAKDASVITGRIKDIGTRLKFDYRALQTSGYSTKRALVKTYYKTVYPFKLKVRGFTGKVLGAPERLKFKIAQWKGTGVYEADELSIPYQGYAKSKSLHPLYGERRLWYAEKFVDEAVASKQVSRVFDDKVSIIGKGVIKRELWRGIPGKMKYVKTEFVPYKYRATSVPYKGKDVTLVTKPGEQISKVTGKIAFETRPGFKDPLSKLFRTQVKPFKTYVGARPSALEKPQTLFGQLSKQYGKEVELFTDLSKTKFFDVRSATKVGAGLQKSFGITRVEELSKVLSAVETKGFLQKAQVAGITKEPSFYGKGFVIKTSKDVFRISGKVGVGKGVFGVTQKPAVVPGVQKAIAEKAISIKPSGEFIPKTPTPSFYEVSQKVAEAPAVAYGAIPDTGVVTPSLFKRAPVAITVGGLQTRDIKQYQIPTLKTTQLKEIKRRPVQIYRTELQTRRLISPVQFGELGEGIKEVEREKIDFGVISPPIQETKVEIAVGKKLKKLTRLGLKSKLKLGLISTPSLIYEPVFPTPTPVEPIITQPPVTPTDISPPFVPPSKKPSLLLPTKKEEISLVGKKPASEIKEFKPIVVLASPFKVQESQIKFGVATSPRTTKKLFKKGILTGFNIPTVELIEEKKGLRKAKKKYDWRLGKNVKPTL